MRYWLELRTALTLAELGTVSATSKEIGVHRATINRHIDTLEAAFQTKLFLRHARGFSLTDAGRDVIKVAAEADRMFSDLQILQRSQAKLATGTLIVTAFSGIAATVMPVIRSFQEVHPDIDVEYMAASRLFDLDIGEAHVAFRTGPKPVEPDYVVLPFRPIRFGLYASRSYVERYGRPSLDALETHRFVAPFQETTYTPYRKWIADHVPEQAIVFRSDNQLVRNVAICDGIGMGFIDDQHAKTLAELVEILPPDEKTKIDLWVATHVDLRRTAKVKSFLDHIR